MVIAAAPAAAQPADVAATGTSEPAPAGDPLPFGYAGLPGGLHVASAETLPAGTFAATALGSFGYRKGLLESGHKFVRTYGDLAFAYAPIDALTVALVVEGRYDKHLGAFDDTGLVGAPRLIARYGRQVGTLRVGAQLDAWVPGEDAPSIVAKAISADARALLSVAAGPGTLGVNAGFRIDNSGKSITAAKEMSLSNQDRVSLGVSDFHAVVGGLQYTVPRGRAFVRGEASLDLFVGAGNPGPLLRAGVSGGYHLADQWSLLGFVELAKVPGLEAADVAAGDITLVPYEPIVTAGIGLQARFGGPARGRFTSETPKTIVVIEYASLTGQVVDDAGKGVVGAKVTVRLKDKSTTTVTDDKGEYTVEQLPIGKTVDNVTNLDDTGAEITVEVDTKKPGKTTVTLAKGTNAAPKVTLEAVLPPGQLRALVRSAGTGKPIQGAVVTIEPGGATATSGADGTVQIDIPPGTYKATVTHGGATQTLDVTIDPNGVTTKNFELRK